VTKNGVEKLASIFDLIKKGLEMHEEKRVRREYAASEFLNKMGSSPRKPDGTKNDRLADWMHRAPPKDVPCKESSLESGDQAAGGSNLDVQLCAKQMLAKAVDGCTAGVDRHICALTDKHLRLLERIETLQKMLEDGFASVEQKFNGVDLKLRQHQMLAQAVSEFPQPKGFCSRTGSRKGSCGS
jgi:hypothetical protein